MGGFADIARHFGLKAIYVLVAWGITRVADAGRRKLMQHRTRRALAPPIRPEARTGPRAAAARYKIYHNPNTDYKPSNPGWLREAASLDPAELATDLSWQCPQLIEFQAKVASQQTSGTSRQQQGQQQHRGSPPAPSRVDSAPPAAVDAIRAGGLRLDAPAGPLGGLAASSPLLPAFGRQTRKQLFSLDTGVVYLNHGSYGAAFRLALEVQSWYQQQLESQPVRFMETIALKGLVAAVADAARFVGASPHDVVPVVNATSAVNAVLASVPLRRGDWVLMLNTTYPAVKSTIARVAAAAGASVVEVQLGLPELQRPGSIVGAVQATLGAIGGGRRVRLAVVDHVVSFPPVVMPVQELVAICKQVGARVLVDGAHAVGNVPGLQVPSLGADYYTTNLHKWGCSPKGAALLWAAQERQPSLLPVVTSHGCRLGFRGEFLWQGTADPSAWLAVPAALAVLRALGPERVALHNARLAAEAASMLREHWGGSTTIAAGRNTAGEGGGGGEGAEQLLVLGGGGEWEGGGVAGMLAVQLPRLREYGCTAEDAARLHRWLREEKRIEVPVVAALDRLWVRISAQIYNELSDYQQLATAISELRG